MTGVYVDRRTLASIIPVEIDDLVDLIEDDYEGATSSTAYYLQDLRVVRLAYLVQKLTHRKVTMSFCSMGSMPAGYSRHVEVSKGNVKSFQALLLQRLATEVWTELNPSSAVNIELIEIDLKQYQPACASLRFDPIPTSLPQKRHGQDDNVVS